MYTYTPTSNDYSNDLSLQAAEQMLKLYDVVYDNDVTMLEINPMVEALDASGNKRGNYSLTCVHDASSQGSVYSYNMHWAYKISRDNSSSFDLV